MVQILLKIARQVPPAPQTWQIFTLDIPLGSTILDCLNTIKWEQDGGLAFRKNCRNTICGSCAMRINGRAALACKESVASELNHWQHVQNSLQPQPHASESNNLPVFTIAPLGNFPVIKDLVVDMDRFWTHLQAVEPYAKTSTASIPKTEFLQPPSARARLDAVANCILCGACYSDCNAREVNPDFVGPHALAKAYRWIADSRDQDTPSRLDAVNNDQSGVWGCTRCLNCNQVCPMEVQPLDRITDVKQAILAQPDAPDTRPIRHRKVLVDLVKQGGWVDERQFGLRVVSNSLRDWAGLVSLGPLGLRMLRTGKFPWFFHPSEGTDEVRSLITEIEAIDAQNRATPSLPIADGHLNQ
jgi:succinate dehydrogenase / fumarate reductase, iron-sulfur subunit